MPATRVEQLPFVERVWRLDRVDSTNTFALGLDELPGKGLFAVIARRQSSGRGQRGNGFFSDVDGGLWLSLVVPLPGMEEHFSVNRALALAAVQAVRSTTGSQACRVKWPNDIYWDERKLGGMLLEASTARPGRLVAGLGLNVDLAASQFPPDIADTATSLLSETGRRQGVEALLVAVLEGFERSRRLPVAQAHAQYTAALLGLGRQVSIGEQTGVLESVAADGRACVVVDGRRQHYTSGPLRFVAS